MTQYALRNEAWEVKGFLDSEEIPDVSGLFAVELAVPIVPLRFPKPDSATKVLLVDETGVLGWIETASLLELQTRAILDIDMAADAARLSVVGDAARIKEYEQAQADAEQYRDAGFAGTVPPGVASWAYAKRRDNWTAQQAAEDILAASARWYEALYGIRAMRLDAKEGARFATTCEEVAATADTFSADLAAAMQGVQ